MAVLTTAQIQAKIDAYFVAGGGITAAELNEVCTDINDSKEPLIQEFNTTARDLLTPFQGQKIFNTTNLRVEIYSNGTGLWLPASQKTIVATDCSGNPNYPEAGVGDQLICSVAGKIGGASGKTVYVGDLIYCIVKNAGGTEASVGTSWQVCYSNSSTDTPTRYTQISLSSAEILALNATPKDLVAAPGASKIIIPIAFVFNYTFVTAAYITNTTLAVKFDGVAGNGTGIAGIGSAASIIKTSAWGNDVTALANTKLVALVQTGDPAAGDGTATLGVYYKIHTVS